MSEFFYDTYALIELYEANPAYAPYAEGGVHLTLLNLFEFNVFLLRAGKAGTLQHWLERFGQCIDEIDSETMLLAAKLKHEHKELSMADCVGYVTAQRLGVKFLTGDRAFKGLKNVEWAR